MSAATCVLLSAVASDDAQAIGDGSWQIDSSAMLYVEEDRVTVNEDVLFLKKEIDDNEFISAKFIYDVMSGPSPSGAPESSKDQIITTPSGRVINIPSGAVPTYAFLDTRYAMLLDWEAAKSRLLRVTNSFSLSTEYDYFSTSVSSVWSKDINKRLSTVTSGLALTYDIIDPVGGVPFELESLGLNSRRSNESKVATDWMIGISHILNRHSIFQFNYTAGLSRGYLTDPYKLIAIVDDASLEPDTVNPYYNEKRPDKRFSHTFYFKYIQNYKGQVFRTSYRYFTDDWQISAHTLDLKYAFPINDDNEIQLHARFYDQSQASFYHYYFVDGTSDPSIDPDDIIDGNVSNISSLVGRVRYASADYRLGNLRTYTLGVKYSRRINLLDGKIDFRVDHIRQQDKENKFSELRAWVVQLVARFIY